MSKENDGELHQQQRKKTNAGMELQDNVAEEGSSGLQTA